MVSPSPITHRPSYVSPPQQGVVYVPEDEVEAEVKIKNSVFIGTAGHTPTTEDARAFISKMMERWNTPSASAVFSFTLRHAASHSLRLAPNSQHCGRPQWSGFRPEPTAIPISIRSTVRYPDASHWCYAFAIGHGASVIHGMSDDGEPSGTAGKPILQVQASLQFPSPTPFTRCTGPAGGLTSTHENATPHRRARPRPLVCPTVTHHPRDPTC